MQADFDDLDALEGQGRRFQGFVYELVVEEARTLGIAPSRIAYDDRVSVHDEGRDIVVDASDDGPNPRFIPDKPSIWSAKSGADGLQPATLRSELGNPRREELRRHLAAGNKYVWCTVHRATQADRDKLRKAADGIAADQGFQPKQIEFRWRQDLTVILNDHPYLIRKHLPEVDEAQRDVLSLSDWQVREEGFDVPWVDFHDRSALKQRVAEHLKAREGANVLHLAGLSGVGKTRTVLEACRDAELQGVFYLPSHSQFSMRLYQYLKRPGRSVPVVIDDVPLAEYDALVSRVRPFQDRLRFVTIGAAPRGSTRQANDPNILMVPEPQTEAGVLQVVTQAGKGIEDSILRSLAQASAHDLRLALKLVLATSRNPEFRDKPVVDINDVWKRLMWLYQDHIGDTNRFRDNYEILTVAIDVGFVAEHGRELSYLAEYAHISEMELHRTIDQAHRCGLGLITPSFFEAIPRALAERLFQDRVWPTLRPNLRPFIQGMPTERLRRRFIERCQACTDRVRQEVEPALGDFFIGILGNDLRQLAHSATAKVFRAWAEMDPNRGLRWLKSVVSRASRAEIDEIDRPGTATGGWSGRRELVWLCENLGCFREHFYDCEEILFGLAGVETETSIGNNSTEIWKSMFWLLFSHTELPFAERFEILLKRLRHATSETLELILDAVVAVYCYQGGRFSPPRIVGGRIVPKQWGPSNWAAYGQLIRSSATDAFAAIEELPSGLRERAVVYIARNLREFLRHGLIEDAKALMAKHAHGEECRRETLAQLTSTIGQYRTLSEEEPDRFQPLVDALLQWKSEFASDDLAAQIRDLTAQGYWAVKQSEHGIAPDEEPKAYDCLASSVLRDPDVLHGLADWLESEVARSAGAFGLSLGKADVEGVVRDTIREWLQGGRCATCVVGYLVAVSDRNQGLSDNWAQVLDQSADTQPAIVVQATLGADVTEKGYARVVPLVARLPEDTLPQLLALGYRPWTAILGAQHKAEIVAALFQVAERGKSKAIGVAFQLTTWWTGQGKQSLDPPLVDPLRQIVERCAARAFRVEAHDWEIVTRLLFPHAPGQIGGILVGVLTAVGGRPRYLERASVKVLRAMAQSHGTVIMDEIGKAIVDPKRNALFRMLVFRGLFDSLGLSVVQQWLRDHEPEYAKYIARHVESPSVDENGEPQIPPLTLWLLTEFEDDDDMFSEFCMGRHSFEVRSGYARDRRAEVERLAAPFLSHSSRRIREWAQYELDANQHEIELDDQNQDELDRT